MRFIAFYKPDRNMTPNAETMAAMNELVERRTKSGHFITAGAFLPAASGKRVRLASGKLTVTEGSDPATQPHGCGFGFLQAGSEQEQIELIEEFLQVAGDGECDIHPLMDGPPPRK